MRLLKQLGQRLAEKDFYQASQLYHSLVKRCNDMPLVHAQLDAGVRYMCTHGQLQAALDLYLLLMSLKCSDATLLLLIDVFPPDSQQIATIVDAVASAPLLHGLGCRFFRLGNYYDAEDCLSRAGSHKMLAMLVKDSPNQSLFLARAVLLLLNYSGVDSAKNLLEEYLGTAVTSFSPSNEHLVNFSVLLVTCLERRSLSEFNRILTAYAPSMAADSWLLEASTAIGKAYLEEERPTFNLFSMLAPQPNAVTSGYSGAGAQEELD